MRTRRRMDRLAPSIQRAHRRVQWAWYASIAHGILLVAVAAHLYTRAEPSWVLAGLALVGAGVVPFLGRTVYRGNSFSALLLLISVLVPPTTSFLRGWALAIPLVGIAFVPVYYLGMKGATGLRGRRASDRTRASRGSKERGRRG